MADDRGSSAAVVLAFLTGTALGALAALVLAPESGSDSREQLRRYARRAENNLRDLAGRAGEVYEEVVGQGREFVDQGKEFVGSKKSALREAFEAGREAMKQERDRLRGEESEEA